MVSCDELFGEVRLAEFRFEHLFHDKHSDVCPVAHDADLAAASLGEQRRLRVEDPGAFGRVVRLQRLIRVFGCRIDVVADADRMAEEVAEEVSGATEFINQVLLFCRRARSTQGSALV